MSETLPPAAEPIALQFRINNSMLTRGLDGLSDDEMWHRLEGHGNPVAWLAGHVAESRAQLLTVLGAPWDAGLGGMFARGSALADRALYPTRQAIEAALAASHEPMRTAFATLTVERLASPNPMPFPGAKTVADLLAFFAFHETYHVGQIAFIRRHLGHSALAG